MHIRAHAASQRRHAGGATPAADDAPSKGRSFSREAFAGLISSLRKAVEKQTWEPSESAWRDYYAAIQSYSDEALSHKEELVATALGEIAPSTVWDFGANTGRFSRIAAAGGADVVAIEMDPSAVELNWRQVADNGDTAVLPLWIDLSNPTPSQGWAHTERASLAGRGPAEAGLALALVHHLAIGGNVPLADIAAWFATACEWLIIEWVPKDDPMVQRLLASREDVFAEYTAEHFEAAIGRWFSIEGSHAVRGSQRILYVLRRLAV
jgi:ribosomal protein L11 methylase PrmA